MRLAAQFKIPNVNDLKQRLTWKEFGEWMAFDGVHGLDDARIEAQLGRFFAAYAGSKGMPNRPIDWMPYRRKPDQSADDMEATLDGMVRDG